jgi:hypothetical protein
MRIDALAHQLPNAHAVSADCAHKIRDHTGGGHNAHGLNGGAGRRRPRDCDKPGEGDGPENVAASELGHRNSPVPAFS